MACKEIPKGSKIMGGKEVKETEAEQVNNTENKKGIEGLKQKMRKEKLNTKNIWKFEQIMQIELKLKPKQIKMNMITTKKF